ncbi:alcohol dehydrogenase catalytic domain-containing protein [Candidatus Protochlamydia phocaeensis]|uniref:alcohol dehydrogenase catalytic domain-containing protein n=1 Tax=Candidatus Protochlamydia phocaeensis TaxID=1414722 RepID=UPI0008390901|nr:alcohol dehydrogenase catalytic domain-containing protein [Candidatus Protochlamydia phocaeensis]
MKALVFHSPKKVSIENVPDPTLLKHDDVIVKVTSTSICGTDLHIFNGLLPQKRDLILGHEFMGIIEEVGKGITQFKKGDRVIVSCIISCGHCFFCQHGQPPQCENSNKDHYGPEGRPPNSVGGGVFAYTDLYGGYDGGQAEYVRVPFANHGLRKIEEGFKDEEVLFLTDIFPTGWAAIDRAQLKGGETVVVFGCGPVGIMCQKAAWLNGAGRVIGVDLLDYRLELAHKCARVETLNLNDVNVIDVIRDMTGGRGADVCVDAVGMEANRSIWEKALDLAHAQSGTINALKACISAVRRGGTVSIIGVYATDYSNFPLGQIFDKGLSIHTGPVPLQFYLDHLMQLVKDKKVILDDIITHNFTLEHAAQAYDLFCHKKDNCLKVVLKP